jgi:hypothetical protein
MADRGSMQRALLCSPISFASLTTTRIACTSFPAHKAQPDSDSLVHRTDRSDLAFPPLTSDSPWPYDVCEVGGVLFVADSGYGTNRVQTFAVAVNTAKGALTLTQRSLIAGFARPWALACLQDGASRVFVADGKQISCIGRRVPEWLSDSAGHALATARVGPAERVLSTYGPDNGRTLSRARL